MSSLDSATQIVIALINNSRLSTSKNVSEAFTDIYNEIEKCETDSKKNYNAEHPITIL